MINGYFRQGKRSSLVSKELRTTPRAKGGLGQIDIDKQIEALHTSLVVKALANPTQAWAAYWLDCRYRISTHIGAGLTDACVLESEEHTWKRLRATKKNGLQPLVVAAYKAWHKADPTVDLKLRATVAKIPLYYNKYIHKQGKRLVPSAAVQKVVETVAVNLGDLYVENDSQRLRLGIGLGH